MKTTPNCKINLGLFVVERRDDGYHNLETIFLPVHSLHDELEITPAEEFRFTQDGIALDNAPMDNLCVKAYRLLKEEFPNEVGTVDMRLKKGIPFGAGLGGGSSDAAFTLKMLNEMFGLRLSNGELEERAARLGADCAFFIENRPAYATGIGDRLEPLELDLTGYRIEIEKPDGESVSTREAYSGITPHRHDVDLREEVLQPVEQWQATICNDFEASVFPSHPAIAALKEEMYRRGALYASMTGSGAAVFAIFRK